MRPPAQPAIPPGASGGNTTPNSWTVAAHTAQLNVGARPFVPPGAPWQPPHAPYNAHSHHQSYGPLPPFSHQHNAHHLGHFAHHHLGHFAHHQIHAHHHLAFFQQLQPPRPAAAAASSATVVRAPASAMTKKAAARANQVDFGPEGRPAFSATIRDPSEYKEDISNLTTIDWDILKSGVTVVSNGVCEIIDPHIEWLKAAFIDKRECCYYSKGLESDADATIVVATAILPDKSKKTVQRIMLGQLWADAFRILGIHFIGKLLALICNQPITIYGLVPQEAIKSQPQRAVPIMVGFWLSIDERNYSNRLLLNLQRLQVMFTRAGILTASTEQQYKRLLEVADRRRAIGQTGLPESWMSIEAAKSPPKRLGAEKEAEIFQYTPAPHLTDDVPNSWFKPFVTRDNWHEKTATTAAAAIEPPQGTAVKPPHGAYTLFGYTDRDISDWNPAEKKLLQRCLLGIKPPLESDDMPRVERPVVGSNWC